MVFNNKPRFVNSHGMFLLNHILLQNIENKGISIAYYVTVKELLF